MQMMSSGLCSSWTKFDCWGGLLYYNRKLTNNNFANITKMYSFQPLKCEHFRISLFYITEGWLHETSDPKMSAPWDKSTK